MLIAPATGYLLIAAACGLAALACFLRMETARWALIGVQTLPTRWGGRGRFLSGQLVALPIVAILLVIAVGSAAQGMLRLLLLGLALAVELGAGFVLPRWPERRAERARKALAALVPSFCRHVRTELAAHTPSGPILDHYLAIAQNDPRKAPLAELVRAARRLEEETRQVTSFQALYEVVIRSALKSPPLVDLVDLLKDIDHDGIDQQAALAAHEAALRADDDERFHKRIVRATNLIMVFAAISVLVGILISLLWVFILSPLITGGF